MKRSPKTDLKIVAVALLVVAIAFLVISVASLPSYRAIFGQPWQRTFVSETDFQFYKAAYRQVCFTIFPLLAGLHIWAAWRILSSAKIIPSVIASK